ncbi:hypothetical protein [Acidithiobacillus caldus]|uniref:hypothetical protein n=1 Tax=Acidithiobacillus caldus TaxID=33059 RepID=UPI001C07AB6F|nr:hypothetical protein [Acidithiobacillus caldus]MBU2764475.1 hypothetical protein [Acidithiobacillus caldus]MBU2771910.1 hypothetical protein [Acidithiobacillus caldus]
MKARNLMLLWDGMPARSLLAVEHPPRLRHPHRYSAGAAFAAWRGDSRDFAALFAELVDLWQANPRQVLRELAKAEDAPDWVRHLLKGFDAVGGEA